MAGTGGYRMGAGRKSQALVEYQELRGTTVRRLAEPEWEKIVTGVITRAINGDQVAIDWLTPWVMGAKPKEPTVLIEGDQTNVIIWPKGWTAQLPEVIDGEVKQLPEPNE